MLRILDCPTGVHKSLRSSLSLGPLSWGPPAAIPGQLADPGLLGGQDQTARKLTPIALLLPRDSHKRAEARPLPVQVCGIPWHDHRHDLRPSLAHRSSDTKIPLSSKEFLVTTETPSTSGDVGTHVIAGEVGSPGKTPDALTPVASEVQLGHRKRSLTSPGTPVPAGGQGHLLVDGKEPPPRGDALRGTPPELRLYSDASQSGWGAHLLDQSASGLWSKQETSLHINILEMKALFLALQAFQDTITSQRVTAMCDNSTVVAYVNKREWGVGAVSDSLCELTGQLLRWTEAHNVLLEARYLPGQSNVLSEPPQPPKPSAGCRVVPPPAGSEKDHPQVGVADHRPVRNPPQCEASSLLPPNPRPTSRLRGRLPPPMEGPRRTHISTLPSRENGGQSQRDPKSLHDSSRSPLAGEGVVRRSPPPTDPTTSRASAVGPPSAPTTLQSVPRRRPRPEPSRVETIKHLLRKSGLSRRASRQLSRCVRVSTACLYQSQWLSFCSWFRGRGVTPIDAIIPVIVDFLIHLRRDKGLSLSAPKGYWATINSVFTLKGIDLANSKELSMLFRSFAKSCSPQPGTWPWSYRA